MERYCIACGSTVKQARYGLGYKTCLSCGEKKARQHKHCIVPLHKSNYVPVYNLQDLVGINSKGGLVR